MKIIIETIPHSEQRYNTVGDWQWRDGELHIKVSKMDDPRFENLVGRHEMDEALLCLYHGIAEREVDAYDFTHEDAGSSDFDANFDAPYYNEHCAALAAEWQFARELSVAWESYARVVGKLYRSYKPHNLEQK